MLSIYGAICSPFQRILNVADNLYMSMDRARPKTCLVASRVAFVAIPIITFFSGYSAAYYGGGKSEAADSRAAIVGALFSLAITIPLHDRYAPWFARLHKYTPRQAPEPILELLKRELVNPDASRERKAEIRDAFTKWIEEGSISRSFLNQSEITPLI